MYKLGITLFATLISLIGYCQNFSYQASPTTENLWEVDFATADTGWIIGNNFTVLNTTDGGQTWLQIPPDNILEQISIYYSLSSLHALKNGRCIIHCLEPRELVLRTNDFGITWSVDTFDTDNVFFIDTLRGFEIDYNYLNDDTIEYLINRTLDFGDHFTNVFSYPGPRQFTWMSSTFRYLNGILSCIFSFDSEIPEGFIAYSTDFGDSWNVLDNSLPPVTDVNGYPNIYFIDSSHIYLIVDKENICGAYNGGLIYFSDDAGQEWKLVNGLSESVCLSVWAFDYLGDDKTLVSIGDSIMLIQNYTEKPVFLYRDGNNIFDIELFDNNVWYVGENGTIIISDTNFIIPNLNQMNNIENECNIPNPVSDQLRIDFKYQTITIYSVNGFTLFHAESLSEIDMSGYARGIYILQIKVNDNKILNSKIVKE